jgi:signal transduction histidine kinase
VDVVVDTIATSVRIRVIDSGQGIPVDQVGRVFDRFHRADPSRVTTDGSGSGLGLTIARAIVTEHGGTLRAASEGIGHGATFTVSLPSG